MPSRDYERIENAIRYLEEHFRQQPELSDLAEHVGLSEFHLQRLFQRWAGISPKKFLQCLTIDYAKTRLRKSASVLDATFDAGLSSPSRLHDLFVVLAAVTPGEYKSYGHQLQIAYGFHDTPFWRSARRHHGARYLRLRIRQRRSRRPGGCLQTEMGSRTSRN